MKLLASVVMVGLVLVPSAVSAPPPGVHEQASLEAAASFVAGKPVTVWCGDDASTWRALLDQRSVRVTADGFADIAGAAAYLDPHVCLTLEIWRTRTYPWGGELLTLVHEAVHLHGVRDESVTDCTALALVPVVASRWFVTRDVFENMTPFLLRRVTDEAWGRHSAAPPDYRRVC